LEKDLMRFQEKVMKASRNIILALVLALLICGFFYKYYTKAESKIKQGKTAPATLQLRMVNTSTFSHSPVLLISPAY
jgi:hypothetical protein